MAASVGPTGIDELRHRYAAQPRRYLAPLANALRQQGAFEEAVTMLRAQLAVYPDHLTGHVVLGQALFDTGALVEARGAFERARALDPGNRVVLGYLGEIASLAGDATAARIWFGRLRAADPYADDVAAQLGGAGAPPDADEEVPVAVAAEREVVEAPQVLETPRAADPAPVAADETAAASDGAHADAAHADAVHAIEARAEPAEPAAGAPAAESFELLEFDAAPVADAPRDAAPSFTAPDLDPVVGLDLPPAAPPAELREADVGEDEGALDQLAAGPFATETMAGLLAAQGHTEQAVALYERLVAERPDDAGLRARLDAIRGAPAAGEPAPHEPVPDKFDRPSAADHAPLSEAAGDHARGALLAAAFADVPARVRGERAEPAGERVFEAAAAQEPPAEEDPFAAFSFDQFFPPEPEPAPDGGDPDDADLARFDAWLRQAA